MRFKHLSALLPALLCAPSAQADTIAYLTTGETGEPVFSDQASPAARRIDLPDFDSRGLTSAEQIEQMLRVADDLASARRSREAARARRTRPAPVVEQPAPAPEPEYRYRRGYYYGYPRPYRQRPHKPPAEAERPSKTFRFEPDL